MIYVHEHQLTIQPIEIDMTSNRGGNITPRFIVIHYTASGSLQSSVNWFKNPSSGSSAHIVIGRDGKVVQMVPFNVMAWHAGFSSWRGINNLNQHSIGIELVNWGHLTNAEPDRWVSWTGRHVPTEQVLIAKHKNARTEQGWHAFTADQIEATIQIGRSICRAYDIEAVIGHDDISPSRKFDPGPAFPMAEVAGRIMGTHVYVTRR